MCLTCNPYCGRCHPPTKRRAVECLDCGKMNTFDDGDVMREVCSFCGGRLPKMRTTQTRRCRYSGLICADPCGRAFEKQPDGVFKECRRRVAPLDATAFARSLKKGPSEEEKRMRRAIVESQTSPATVLPL